MSEFNPWTHEMENKVKIVTMVFGSMFGRETYYRDSKNKLIKLAETIDMEFVSKLAVYVRREMNMRNVSHALTAVIAEHGKPYIKQTVAGVVLRADDITEILACYISMYKKSIPNGLKKGLASALLKFDEYDLAKHKGTNKAISIRDVLRLVHPVPKNKEQEILFGKVIKNELQTWQTQLSSKGSTKEAWEDLIDSNQLGYTELLSHLNRIINAEPSNIHKVYDILKDKEQILKSKQLPFGIYFEYNRLSAKGKDSSKVLNVMETAIEHSFLNMKKIKGKTLLAIDVSHSMTHRVSKKSYLRCEDIACLFASMANKIFDDAIVVSFDSTLKKVDISANGGIIQNVKPFGFNGGGTAKIAVPLKYLLQENIKVDRMILLSSYLANHHSNVIQQYAKPYRKKVNSDFWVHAVDLHRYSDQKFIALKTNIISGWSENLPEFISLAEKGAIGFATTIEKYNI